MSNSSSSILNTNFKLPNGNVIANRIVKSAMSENMGTKTFGPSTGILNLYKTWAKSGAGILITGNVMIDRKAIGEPRNVVVEDDKHIGELTKWADCVKGTQTQIWAQINHPGRQAMEQLNKVLKAPSSVPLKMIGRKNASKKIPQAMTEEEILDAIQRFANTALILKKAGFHGVQIHGAHGYLVSQFLSPLANIRTDKWGGSIQNRARFVLEVQKAIRKEVGPDFSIGIKMNSADFQRGGFSEEEAMEVVKMLSETDIDMIEISGGNYESPELMRTPKKSTIEREAFFMEFIEKARAITKVPLLLTGGFRSVKGMETAVESGNLDFVGLARPYAVYPNLANQIINREQERFDTTPTKTGVKALDVALNIFWYEAQMKRIGDLKEPKHNLPSWPVIMKYVGKIAQRKVFG